MELFCGNNSDFSVKCETSTWLILSSSGFSYFFLVAIAYLKWSRRDDDILFRDKWRFHNERGITALCLGIIQISGLASSVFSGLFWIIWAELSNLIAWSIALFLYVFLEQVRLPGFVSLLASYWLLTCVIRSKEMAKLLNSGLTWRHMDVNVSALISCASFALFVMDLITMYVEIKRKNYSNSAPATLAYSHSTSNVFSQITFSWLLPLLRAGFSAPLELDALGSLEDSETAKSCFTEFNDIFRRADKNSLWRCYLRYVWPNFFIGGVLKLLGDGVGLIAPLGIAVITNYASGKVDKNVGFLTIEEFFNNGYVMGVVMLCSSLAQGAFSQSSTHFVNVEGIRLKTALQALIYDKCLRLAAWASLSSDQKTTASAFPMKINSEENIDENAKLDCGIVTNLITEDASNVMSIVWIGHYSWALPLKILVIIYLLYGKLGISAVIGSSFCILTMTPLQFWIGKKMTDNSKSLTDHTDHRLSKLIEVLQSIKVVKLHDWTELFKEKINRARSTELDKLNRDSVFWTLLTFVTHSSSILITVVTFGCYFILEEDHLTAANVFAALALFNQLTVPLFIFPVTVPIIISAIVSTRRIEKFLELPEAEKFQWKINENKHLPKRATLIFDPTKSMRMNAAFPNLDNITEINEEGSTESDASSDDEVNVASDEDYALRIKNAVFAWGNDEGIGQKVVVNDLRMPNGKIAVIIGSTGSGKSSLLAALMGEMNLVRGKMAWSKRDNVKFCYAAQRPWLQNNTFRENVTFGYCWRARRYQKVISACGLQPDVDLLPEGDLTRLGWRGLTLSGGQRARVALARALYAHGAALLDAPLSSLDAPLAAVARRALKKSAPSRCATLLVADTNSCLTIADIVIAMDNGSVRVSGTLSEIEKSDPELAKVWKSQIKQDTPSEIRGTKGKTAKERWCLLKSVNRISLQLKTGIIHAHRWCYDEELPSLRRSYSSLESYRNFMHDLFLPADEWCVGARMGGRRATRKARRGHTLQLRRTVAAPVFRQMSSPVSSTTGYSKPTPGSRKKSLINKLFSSNRNEIEHIPVKRLVSTESSFSEDPEDEYYDDEQHPKVETDEIREYGKISRNIYSEYINRCGRNLTTFYLCLALGWQGMRVATDFWLNEWTARGQTHLPKSEALQYMTAYAALSLASILLSFASSAIGQWAGAQARKKLHDDLLNAVLECPVRFFETTPFGRILNRFSTDIGIIDKKIAMSVQRLLQFLFLCASAIFVNAVVTPWFVLVAVPICGAYYLIQKIYRRSARELQRLDGLTRSPIVSHFTETLSGLSTIRAYNQRDRFSDQLWRKIDVNTNVSLLLNSTNRWLGIALDFLGAVIVYVATMVALICVESYPGAVTPSLVGLAINYTLLVPIYLNWVVKFLSDMEMYMGSVERIHQYIVTPGEDERINGLDVFDDWPTFGEIIFKNVSVSHGPSSSCVLHDINLTISPGQKVAICGRSGSGKSTLLMALFQMAEVQQGAIKIDDADLKSIKLSHLRRRMFMIPQEVTVFSGTIRENLDPRRACSDDVLWKCLEIAQLKDFVVEHCAGLLDSVLESNASAWSGGRSAGLGVARCAVAALTERRAVLLAADEATASMDEGSERSLLAALQRNQPSLTILSVAHRLEPIISLKYDRVIVLEEGRIVEDGVPNELLKNNESKFSALVRAAEE